MPCEDSRIGAVTGLRAEARLLTGCAVACGGGDPDRAEVLARRLLAEGAAGMVSFGIAGGLRDDLRPGTLVVGEWVVSGEAVLACDEAWSLRLLGQLPGSIGGTVVGARQAVTTPAAKRRLARRWQAVSVDLESAAVARVCAQAGKPFAVLRAIADPVEREIPAPALAGLDLQGRMQPGAVAARLLRQPQHLLGLVRLGWDSRAALTALGRAVRLLGPSLGFQTL
ncbi:MAG TPA: nucleoside phosphorylase [Patescibacteria group bacterium]|nr:nucleoside phosphorylase [Patescibacteria group bacterium]